jgi:hypothetical protein
MLKAHTAKRIGQGKTINPTFFCMRFAISSAAGSASIKNGIGQVFLSVILDRMNPGQIVFTWMLCSSKCNLKASPYAFTHALEALYDGHAGRPWYPAIEAVIAMILFLSLRFL